MSGNSGSVKEAKLVQVVRASLKGVGLATDSMVLVGFSGGRDSTSLLAALRSILPNLQAVHVDHAVRVESAEDAVRVAELAERIGVPLTVVRLDGDVISRHPGVGVEEALRRERYRVFADVATAIGAEAVALGHHEQDQAETVLLHLLRGAGLSGVVGMREFSTIDVPWWGESSRMPLPIWRPFLDVSPDELDSFVAGLGVSIVDDPSNEDRRFRRNTIRHDVLPLLEQVSPGATGNLARFGSLVGDEDAFLESLAVAMLGEWESIARDLLLEQPMVVQRRMIRIWLKRHLGEVEVSRDRIEAVVTAAAERRGSKQIEIGGGWSVEVGRDVLTIVMGIR